MEHSTTESANPARRALPLAAPEFTPAQVAELVRRLHESWHPPAELAKASPVANSARNRERADRWPMRYLQFEVVNVCNFRCPLCQTLEKDGVTRGRISVEDAARIVLPVADQLEAVVLYGNRGEPLLHKQLEEIVAMIARSSGARIVISTNGSLVTPDRARALMQAGLSQFVFAVDGVSQEAFGAYRVGGKIDEVLYNLKEACAIRKREGFRTRIIWQFIPMATNEHEKAEVTRLGYELGVDDVRFKLSRSVAKSARFRPSEAADRPAPVEDKPRFDCPYGMDKLYVDPNGDAYPCCWAEGRGLYLGNALETPIDALWDSPKMWELRRTFLDQSGFHPFCESMCNKRTMLEFVSQRPPS